jgi:dienelactone hydrolase
MCAAVAWSQADPRQLVPLLEEQIQPPEVTAYELRGYLLEKIPRLPAPVSSRQWTDEARRLRRRALETVYHGWPTEWVESPAKFQDLGPIEGGKGYRMRKLRYEIVPGFESTAILYEPEEIKGRIPAILNVNGHTGPPGKAAEYKQKRCINQALRGMMALSLEWLNMGELYHPENEHRLASYLNLAGANAVGLFYLAMRKGLDYLYTHPSVDQKRIGMTGLSSGGWQTILLTALDERVSVAVPVAGFASYLSRLENLHRLERVLTIGDLEQNAADLFSSMDFAHLVAMCAPRPTLLIYNAEDDCCFRAPWVKREIFDAVIPFFRLYGKPSALGWHENSDPGDHNYQLDNRLQSYRFFATHFDLDPVMEEIPVGAEVKSAEKLKVGLPKDNLTILGLARKLAGRIDRAGATSAQQPDRAAKQRELLRQVVRFRPVEVDRAWIAGNTHRKGVETISYRFECNNGLSAVGTYAKAIGVPGTAPAGIVIADGGRKTAQADVATRVNRGQQVIALDPIFVGELGQLPRQELIVQALAALGERSLGMEAAQLLAVARWLRRSSNHPTVALEAAGMRSQVTALVAAALEPESFSEVVVSKGIPSLRDLFDKAVEPATAPELFCLDLYAHFDIDALAKLSLRRYEAPGAECAVQSGEKCLGK